MIKCPNCHQECVDDAHFCGNCASPLKPGDVPVLAASDVEKLSTPEDDFVGKCIDNKYYIEKKLAAGGMGVVYLARQKGVGQEVAIKKLHAGLYSDKTIVERFIDEARSYGRITHPNAVKLHDLLNVNGQICIIMEFVHGKTLTQYIEERYPFTMRQIIDISLQIADALGTVHQAGIIHRDLKTENIMLMETVSGRFSVKILDFGIAKMMDKPAGRTTQEGVLVGTPEFMSPEQCYGNAVDHRADIYSYGILMYVMVCGKLPFIADRALALLQQQVNSPVPPMIQPDGSEVPAGVQAIVLKCMEKDPNHRYQCFADVITDLTCCQEGRETSIAVIKPILADPNAQKGEQSSDLEGSCASDTVIETEKAPEFNPQGLEAVSLPPRHSAEFAVYLNDERDIKFSLDDGEMTLSDEDDKSLASSESDDDHEGFSLGDIQGIDCSLSELEPVHDRGEKSGAIALTIAIVVVVILICFVFMTKTGKLDLSAHGITLPAFLLPEQEIAYVPQAFAPQHGIIPDETPEAMPEPEAETVPEVAQPESAAPQIEPVAPSEAVTRQVLESGVQRALFPGIQAKLQAGDIKSAQSLLSFLTDQKVSMQPSELTQYETLMEQSQQLDEIYTSAQSAAAKENCDVVNRLIDRIPEDAEGMRAEIQKMAKKCYAKLSAPPSTL